MPDFTCPRCGRRAYRTADTRARLWNGITSRFRKKVCLCGHKLQTVELVDVDVALKRKIDQRNATAGLLLAADTLGPGAVADAINVWLRDRNGDFQAIDLASLEALNTTLNNLIWERKEP